MPANHGQTLYAWVQNYTSSWVAVWVRLPNGIPATSSVKINIVFTNSVQYPYTGIAPYLTSTYGQYDNGQYVFPVYPLGDIAFVSFTRLLSEVP